MALSKIDTAAIATDAIEAAQLKSDAIASGDLPTGTPLQIVQNTTTSTAQYASNTYVATALTCDITPKYANSKFHIHVSALFGSNTGSSIAHDVAFAWNLRDSLNPSGANAAIAPDSTTGGTDTSGASGTRMGGYHAGGCFANVANVANFWIWDPNFSSFTHPAIKTPTREHLVSWLRHRLHIVA